MIDSKYSMNIGVKSELVAASYTKRFLSMIIDEFVIIVLAVLCFVYGVFIDIMNPIMFFLLFCNMFFYELISTRIFGETLGRKLVNIKLVNIDGSDISYTKRFFRHCSRNCFVHTGMFILYIFFLPTYYNPRKLLPHEFGVTRVINN